MRHYVYLIAYLWITLTSVSVFAEAQIYQWQDQDKTYYSDRPHRDAKVVRVNPGYAFYQVKRVIDGDTLELDDKTKVRLLGINTPEIAGRDHLAENGGWDAKQWVIRQLRGQRVRLETDVEARDRYQRTLGHVFTEDGHHINLELVRNGLASVEIFPPNLKYAEELMIVEQSAQQHNLGIWREPAYAVKAITDVDPNNPPTGWQRLTGVVKSLGKSRRYSYLNFNDQFSFRIADGNLKLFPKLQSYVGRQVEIRGWLNRQKSGVSMLIRHPHAIKLLP